MRLGAYRTKARESGVATIPPMLGFVRHPVHLAHTAITSGSGLALGISVAAHAAGFALLAFVPMHVSSSPRVALPAGTGREIQVMLAPNVVSASPEAALVAAPEADAIAEPQVAEVEQLDQTASNAPARTSDLLVQQQSLRAMSDAIESIRAWTQHSTAMVARQLTVEVAAGADSVREVMRDRTTAARNEVAKVMQLLSHSDGATHTPAPASSSPIGVDRGPAAHSTNTPPVYPEEARRRGQAGVVLIHVHIDSDGAVSSTALRRSSGFALLDDAALKAVAAWRFTPATVAGAGIACEADVPVEFVLRR